MIENILFAIALLFVLKGIGIFLIPKASKPLVTLAYGKFGSGVTRALVGLGFAVIGIVAYYFAPIDTVYTIPVIFFAIAFFLYGLMLLLISESANRRLIDAFYSYSTGKIRILGIIVFLIGIAIWLATLAYYPPA